MSAPGRWRSDPRVLLDLFVVAVVAVLAIADLASVDAGRQDAQRPADALAYALVVCGAAALYWRRRVPVAVLGFVVAVLVVVYLRDYGAFLSVLGLPALYAVAAHEEQRATAWWALVAGCVVIVIAACLGPLDRADGFAYLNLLSVVAFLAAAIGAGVVIRNRERIFVDTERRAAEAEAQRVADAVRLVALERSRIAREMHDVVAHSISVIAVQAAAGREIVRANPDRAADVFERIETVGREALAELRRMLGVLRDASDAQSSLAPQPGIEDVATLVDQSSAAGLTTDLHVEGSRRPLAPGVELAAFRIVQEALTNALKHAGTAASATVRIAFGDTSLDIEVTDDGRGAATALSRTGSGLGLLGIRERVEIYGGALTSGPRPGGGYSVRAVLPIVGDTATVAEAAEEAT
jgi:signal transduction histidine kinase